MVEKLDDIKYSSNIDKSQSMPHVSVLLDEIMLQLQPFEEGYYVDATFGAGGYTNAILAAHDSAKVIAFDKDPSVKKFADKLNEIYSNRIEFIHSSYDQIDKFLVPRNILLNGIVYDLGVSSMQFDDKKRGFSFEGEDLLDMRMDTTQSFSAFDVVNQYDENKLADIIYHYGGERKSRAIAKRIVKIRTNNGLIRTTKQLCDIICSVVRRSGKIHPATRTFQAIRIEVNDEFNQLEVSIKNVLPYIKVGGKMIAVTFHSGEDRIVKKLFNEATSKNIGSTFSNYYERNLPVESTKNEPQEPEFVKLNKKVVVPSDLEIGHNIRARSAKLRGIKRVKNVG